MSKTKVPALSTGLGAVPSRLRPFLSAVVETMMVRARNKGDALDGAVTFRDLVDAGIATSPGYKGNGSFVDPAAVQDNSTPSALIGFSVSAGAASAVATWNHIAKSNHAHVEVWVSDNPSMVDAVVHGTSAGQIYVASDLHAEHQYWFSARSISDSGITGEFAEPVRVIPYADERETVDTSVAAGGHPVQGLPYLYIPPGGVEIDGVLLEEGTYFLSLFIANGSIVRAQIAKASINSGNFKNLSASKILFNEAQGKVLDAAVILGGLISGTRFEGSEMIGGVFNGTRITVGGEEVPAIDIRGSDGVFSINSPLKVPGKIDSFDAIELAQGSIAEVIYVPDFGQAKSQVMSRIESGTASSNDEVVLPGYWRDWPKIIVTPSEITMPDPASDSGSRTLLCSASNMTRKSDDPTSPDYYKVSFTATARVSSTGTSRNIRIGNVFNYSDSINPRANTSVLASAGSKESELFVVPATSDSAYFSTSVEIYEWITFNFRDLDFVFARGSVSMQFLISSNGGTSWEIIGSTGGFNSNGRGMIIFNHSFTFSPSNSQRMGKLIYTVGRGSVEGVSPLSNFPNDWLRGNIPFARIHVSCDSVLYPVDMGENYLNGKLDWLAISR